MELSLWIATDLVIRRLLYFDCLMWSLVDGPNTEIMRLMTSFYFDWSESNYYFVLLTPFQLLACFVHVSQSVLCWWLMMLLLFTHSVKYVFSSDAYDREFRNMYDELPSRDKARMRVPDRAPNQLTVSCRKLFGNLEFWMQTVNGCITESGNWSIRQLAAYKPSGNIPELWSDETFNVVSPEWNWQEVQGFVHSWSNL